MTSFLVGEAAERWIRGSFFKSCMQHVVAAVFVFREILGPPRKYVWGPCGALDGPEEHGGTPEGGDRRDSSIPAVSAGSQPPNREIFQSGRKAPSPC